MTHSYYACDPETSRVTSVTGNIETQILALLSNKPIFLKDIFVQLNGVDRAMALSALSLLTIAQYDEEVDLTDKEDGLLEFGAGFKNPKAGTSQPGIKGHSRK